jgi:hypothetical protein
MTTPPPTIKLNPGKLLISLILITAILVVFSIWGQRVRYFGVSDIRGSWHEFVLDLLMSTFYMDNEVSIPTYFNTLLLVFSFLLLAAISTWKYAIRDKFRFHWIGLSLIFLFLSIDEASVLHERLMKPMRNLVDVGGVLHFSWIIPGMIAVSAFFLLYFIFFLNLDRKFKILFLFSLGVYIGGVIGGEMVSGYYASKFGQKAFAYGVAASFEESIEMIGASLIVYSLLDYIKTYLPEGLVLKVT